MGDRTGDLISREVLMRAVEEFFKDIGVYDVTPFEAVSDFESILDSVPTVDAEPVRRGIWEGWHGSKMRKDGEYQYFRYHSCSECGRRTAVKSNYCPNCGAKMKEGSL